MLAGALKILGLLPSCTGQPLCPFGPLLPGKSQPTIVDHVVAPSLEDSYPYLAKQGTCHQTKCTAARREESKEATGKVHLFLVASCYY